MKSSSELKASGSSSLQDLKEPGTNVPLVEGPAIVGPDHAQDRPISKEIGAPRAYRRLDGLDYLRKKGLVHRHQIEAGRRLQCDYEQSQMQAGAKSGNAIISNSSRRGYEIPDAAIDANKRVEAALAVLPQELLSMTILFLLPDFREAPFNIEKIAERVREDKRAISLGVRSSLSLLARHYGAA